MEQTITDKIKALFLKKRNILILIFFYSINYPRLCKIFSAKLKVKPESLRVRI